ncbi:MAG: sorbosone dehydrogenase family protein, partial [Acidobacteriota bacterium]
MKYLRLALVFAALALPVTAQSSAPDLGKLKLPPGFEIEVFAADVAYARSLTVSPSGVVYVGTMNMRSRDGGNVYALVDSDGDFRADRKVTLLEGLYLPNGVAWNDGDLFVAEVDKVLRLDDIDASLESPPAPVVVNDTFPSDRHHGWKFIRFGPDGKLYVPVGAPCN